ncbi:MAG: FAD-dependent oxidoreductase [Vicinamibacterales bacterium]|nr:FAD-dependent oxidoreductase [Vicinamibacterales bacterium]
MRIRFGVSPWIQQFPDSRRPRFEPLAKGDYAADVVIVGAGLTGSVTAYLCAAAGLKTMVLEADRVGLGASGRSAGLLSSAPEQPFRDVVERLGLKDARQAYASWAAAALDGAALLRKLKIQCNAVPVEMVTVPWRESERLLQKEYAARHEAGLDGAWLTRTGVQRALRVDADGGVRTKGALLLDPYKATVGMIRAAAAGKARVFEKTKVTKITFDRKIAQVKTAHASITTGNVVITTGVATAETRQLQRHVGVRERYHVLTAPLTAAMRKGLFLEATTLVDARSPARRVRWTDEGRLLISGGDQKVAAEKLRDALCVHHTNELMYESLLMYPSIFGLKPEFGWASTYGDTIDGLPCIGPHRFFPHHLLALGSSGDSLTDAFLSARILLRAVKGKPEKADAVFSWKRLG